MLNVEPGIEKAHHKWKLFLSSHYFKDNLSSVMGNAEDAAATKMAQAVPWQGSPVSRHLI